MCVVSMVTDHYYDKWREMQRWPNAAPPTTITILPLLPAPSPIPAAEIEEFKNLLERAREYDRKNNEPDCELKEKRERLLKLAEELGVKIDFL